MSQYSEIVENGLWKQNPGVVQLLGLCPTLAVTSTAINGLSLGIATSLVMALSNASVSPVRKLVPDEIRIPVFILIIAALVTIVDLSMNAYLHPLYNVLGIFIPLIVTNCIVLARVEAFAAKNPTPASALDGLVMGLGLTFVLTLLGAMREFVGKGTVLSGLDLVFGPQAKSLVWHVIPDYPGFLLAILPPGAFIGLGLLIAGRNWVEQRRTAAQALPPFAASPSH
ncbi:MAG TPA: electron transport complex subunit E [Methylophilaceae bacterium]|nr:electron transport complex subunit E [Methylophilaceae bacterium]